MLSEIHLQVCVLAVQKEAAGENTKQEEGDLQRLDTAARLELAAQKEQSWVRRTAIKVGYYAKLTVEYDRNRQALHIGGPSAQ